MTKAWKTEFFETLSKKLGTFTDDNLLLENEVTGEWMTKTVFATSPEKTDFVLLQAIPFQVRENVLLLEIYITLTDHVKPEAVLELQKAIQELNVIMPMGTFGIFPGEEHVYLRNCYRLDTQKPMEEVVADTIIDYELMMECIFGAFPGLKAIWNGEMTYQQAVDQDLLKKYSK